MDVPWNWGFPKVSERCWGGEALAQEFGATAGIWPVCGLGEGSLGSRETELLGEERVDVWKGTWRDKDFETMPETAGAKLLKKCSARVSSCFSHGCRICGSAGPWRRVPLLGRTYGVSVAAAPPGVVTCLGKLGHSCCLQG